MTTGKGGGSGSHREVEQSAEDTRAGRGGRRRNAGRKKTGRCRDAPHRRRPTLSAAHPVHVVLRTAVRVSWRTGAFYALVRKALQGTLGRPDFRIVHVSIQHTHVHLLVEASDRRALSRGMQSFTIRLARLVHHANARRVGCGKVFAFRYHATQIRTARHARHALAYVLNNWRRHRADDENRATRAAKLDPYASGMSFDGWRGQRRWRAPGGYVPLPVARPQTALLGADWQIHGLIDLWETPGPLPI